MISIRQAKFPDDAAAIAKIDAALRTSQIYRVTQDGDALHLRRTKVSPPFKKTYSLEHFAAHAPPCDFFRVAIVDGRIVGFIAGATEGRNRRCAIWHFYVDSAHRKRGIGRELMKAAEAHAREAGANHLWIETQNVNIPAIAAYRALGFELCGLDTTLYAGTAEEGEIAIFLARSLVE